MRNPTQIAVEVTESAESKSSQFAIPATILTWLILAVVSKFCYLPPAPVSIRTDDEEFSALRAEKFLKEIVGDGIPHPAGSEQNQVVRKKIADRLTTFGLEVTSRQSQQSITFRRTGNEPETVPIVNLIARRPGDPDLGSIILVAHYDSVPFGPGASDDGVAVAAVVEIARMAQKTLPPGREIIFLFTDGEEFGLLGAREFAAHNDLVSHAEFVINLEARGTSGASLMFQTSSDSLQMVELFAKVAKRPVTSSIFEEVYKRLPNDTDFTIFRDTADLRGFNFAFIGDARNYHTRADNYENVDRGSLQHHGDNAWALIFALNTMPNLERTNDSAVYFDVFSRFVVVWNSRLSMLAATAITLVLLVFSGFLFAKRKANVTNVVLQSGLLLVSCTAIAASLFALDFSFEIQDRFDPPWVDHPEFVSLAFWSTGITVGLFLLAAFGKWNTEFAAWLVTWLVWAVLAMTTSHFIVGASYIFLVPVVTAVVLRVVVCAGFGMPPLFAHCFSSAVAAFIWMPIGVLFYDAIGFSINTVVVIRVGFMCTTLFPVAAQSSRRSIFVAAWFCLLLAVASTSFAIVMNLPG